MSCLGDPDQIPPTGPIFSAAQRRWFWIIVSLSAYVGLIALVASLKD
jgi:hypothetical protein